MTTATVNRYALNDFLTAYLSDLGWCANTEDDMEALNECVHTCADAVERLMAAWACRRCGSPIVSARCTDETCPLSDRPQDADYSEG